MKIIPPEKYRNNKGCFIFDYQMPFPENVARRSRVRYNPSTKVCDIYLNCHVTEPQNPTRSTKTIQYELKSLLGANKFICIVGPSIKPNGYDYYALNVQFYYTTDQAPDYRLLQKVPDIISDNLIPYEYQRTDIRTGVTEVFEFSELPKGNKWRIIQECNRDIKELKWLKWDYV